MANAIHTESSIFSSGLIIRYNDIRIDTVADTSTIINLFSISKFSMNDLRNIIYIYVSLKEENLTQKTKIALDYINKCTRQDKIDELKHQNDLLQQKCLNLKKKKIEIELQNIDLQQNNKMLIQMCNKLYVRNDNAYKKIVSEEEQLIDL